MGFVIPLPLNRELHFAIELSVPFPMTPLPNDKFVWRFDFASFWVSFETNGNFFLHLSVLVVDISIGLGSQNARDASIEASGGNL